MKKDFAVRVLYGVGHVMSAMAKHGSRELKASGESWPPSLRGAAVRLEVIEPGVHRGAVLQNIHILEIVRQGHDSVALMHSPFPFYEHIDIGGQEPKRPAA